MFSAIERLLREAQIEAREARRLAEYGEMLLVANQRTNLTGAKTPEGLVSHLLDSLALPIKRRLPIKSPGCP
jgi:16S rRNA G527 N7-methylase RsmG